MNNNENERSWLLKKALREVFDEYGIDEETRKAVFKEAIQEWLDAKFDRVKKLSLDGAITILVAIMAIVLLFTYVKQGSK